MILDFGNILLNMGQGNWTAISFKGPLVVFHMTDGYEHMFERREANEIFNRWLESQKRLGRVIRAIVPALPQDDADIPVGY